jgi:SAM-dependent methyltransferase
MSDSEIFDRKLRRTRRNRAAMLPADTRVLDLVSEDLIDRLQDGQQRFEQALLINCAADLLNTWLHEICGSVTRADPGALFAQRTGGIMGDEDYPIFGSKGFDLIISVGLLDTVNDVPGALALLRRALKPGGMMLCAFAGAGSLATLRDALRAVEPHVQRTHPMIDVRAGGDLLARAGFARPVADTDTIHVTYDSSNALIRALRANAGTNLLQQRQPMRRDIAQSLKRELERQMPIRETISVVTLTGWAPASDQLLK